MPQNSNKITAQHLERKAVVYLRQSSERQVQQNTESQRLQYKLEDRACELGFKQVEIIDTDLGCSAAIGAARREGFERLVASVAIGEVGLILSREVSRLSRTDKDWCQLLEVCQLFGTLIGDAEHVYDLSLMDDQLVLGIKGTLSVVELKVLNLRLQQGMEEKARRGELARLLPPGYVRDGTGKVTKDPDRRVQEAIDLVFGIFRKTRSIRQTFVWFKTRQVELPVNKSQGAGIKLIWQVPSHAFVSSVLHNPFYAGAYVWGQRRTELVLVSGKLAKRTGRLRRPEQCRVFIPSHHEGYIDWETFEENLGIMRNNTTQVESDEAVGAVRAGKGLLAGLLRCGCCGRKLHVRYWGKSGTSPRYSCKGDFDTGGKYCLAFGGAGVDRRFSQELLKVLSPLGMRASLAAIERLCSREQEQRQALQRQLEQLEYEARRAFEQYDEVDPRHRLVAAELESRWNAKLEATEKVKSAIAELDRQVPSLTDQEREAILALGERFEDVWESESCPVELRKTIIRTVVNEVIVNSDSTGETLRFIIHWNGGSHTQFEMAKPQCGMGDKTSLEDVDVVRRMAVRYGDDEIARVLNKLGRRTGKGNRWNKQRVATVRRKYAIEGHRHRPAAPEILTLRQAATYCGVSPTAIKRLVANGLLESAQVVPWAPWEIKRSDLDSAPVREALAHLHAAGKLPVSGDNSGFQHPLFS